MRGRPLSGTKMSLILQSLLVAGRCTSLWRGMRSRHRLCCHCRWCRSRFEGKEILLVELGHTWTRWKSRTKLGESNEFLSRLESSLSSIMAMHIVWRDTILLPTLLNDRMMHRWNWKSTFLQIDKWQGTDIRDRTAFTAWWRTEWGESLFTRRNSYRWCKGGRARASGRPERLTRDPWLLRSIDWRRHRTVVGFAIASST